MLKRLHLVEIEDLPWIPAWLRDAITEYLLVVIDLAGHYVRLAPLIGAALARTGSDEVVDLCSGAGGPWRWLYGELKRTCPTLKLTLSDRFPNAAGRQLSKEPHLKITYWPHPVDAKNVPAELSGFRTLFTAFHHFRPEDAEKILRDAVAKRQGIGIFEFTHRGIASLFVMALSPFAVWCLTPRIRPFRWWRIVWTYLIPAIPLAITFDGLVSCLRTYSREELKRFIAPFEPEYEWEIGEIRSRASPFPTTYLIGTPKGRR